MELIIEEGLEPLRNLLEFCKLQNSGMTYDIEYFETLTMIVKASENIQQNVF